MNYTEKNLIEFSNGQLNSTYFKRAIVALNGLSELINEEWIEKELVAYYYKEQWLIDQLGKSKVYKGISEVEKLIFLWEDLEILKELVGFDDLLRKLKNGFNFENVDLEISIAADLIRCNSKIELEPFVGVGQKKADCKFQIQPDESWTFVEITRKQNSTTQKLIDDRGKELAELVSLINPERRCVIVVKKELNKEEYNKLCAWLKSKPDEGEFYDLAVFFSVPHNQDDTQIAFKYTNTPVSVRQSSGNILSNAFGVVYLHIPDYGAKNKMKDKIEQLPTNSQGIYFIDLSNVAGGIKDWENQIEFTEEFEHFSAIVLIQTGISSSGHLRECKIILNQNSTNKLSDKTIDFITQFCEIRKNKNLI